jgi:hypothetical protein
MFKKILLVLMVVCFLLGMATKAEVEGVKEEAEKVEDSADVEVEAAVEPTSVADTPQIRLTTVYEKTFDEEIVDVIFDTATVSIGEATARGWKNISSIGDKVKIDYPRIGIKPKDRSGYTALVFFNKEGSVVNRVEVDKEEHINISPSGEYVLVGKVAYEGMPIEGGVIYNSSGQKIIEIPKHTLLVVSNEGDIIAHEVDSYLGMDIPAKSGSFYIYDNKGNVINEIKSPVEEGGAPAYAKFTEDGHYAALMFEGFGVPPCYLYLIKKNGEVLWKADFTEYRFAGGEGLDVTANVGVAVKLSNKVVFVDWEGNVKWENKLDMGGDMIVKIDKVTRKVFVVSGMDYIWCYDIDSGARIWRYMSPWANEPNDFRWEEEMPHFKEVVINDSFLYVLGHWTRSWTKTILFVLDANTGKLLRQEEYPDEKVTFGDGVDKPILYNMTKNCLIQIK